MADEWVPCVDVIRFELPVSPSRRRALLPHPVPGTPPQEAPPDQQRASAGELGRGASGGEADVYFEQNESS